MKSKLWFFSKDEDPHVRADEPADAKSVQPDHYPNVARPGGGYPEGRGHKTDAFCNKCDDQLVDGYCVRCDWGPQSVSENINNFPIDPFEDDKAGIRAANLKFSRRITKDQMVEILSNYKDQIFSDILIPMFKDPTVGDFSWEYSPAKNYSYIYRVAILNFVKDNNLWTIPKQRSDSDLNQKQALSKGVWEDFKRLFDADFKSVESDFQKYKLVGRPWFEANPEIYQEIIDTIIKPELYENYNTRDHTTMFNLINGMLNEYGFKITHNSPEWQYQDESGSPAFNKFLWKIQEDALQQIKTEDYKLYMEILYNRETGTTEGGSRIQLCQAMEDVMRDAREENIYGWSLLSDQDIAERVGAELDDPSITGDKIKDVYAYMRNHPSAFIDAHRTPREVELAPMRSNPEFIERRIGFEAVETRLLQSLKNLINTNERRLNLGEDPIRFNFDKWLSESGATSLGFDPKSNIESLRKFLNQIAKKRDFNERINPEWLFSGQSSYDYRKPGQIYIFQIGNMIKIGITNNIRGRIKGYNESGLQMPKYDEQNWKTIFYDLEKSTEETQLHGADPEFKGVRPWRLKSNVEDEKAEQDNAYFVSDLIEDGRIPLRIERAIMSFWQSLGLGVDRDFIHRTETITSDPQSVEQGIATDLGLDFHVFLISQMLENRGQLPGLNTALNIDDKRELLEFFDYDVNKLFEVFGDTELGKALKFDFEIDDQGNIISISRNWQKAALASTEDNQKVDLLQFGPRSPYIEVADQQSITNPSISYKHFTGGSVPENQLLKEKDLEYAKNYLLQVNEKIKSGELMLDSDTGNVIWVNDPSQIAITKPWLDFLTNLASQDQTETVAKTSDYQGWSNWDTWNTALYINNEPLPQETTRKIVYDGGSEQDLANWVIPNVIGPVNRQILENAQEWNNIPYEDRPTGRENLSERMQEMAEGFDALFGHDPQSDELPDVIEEDKVNWNEIYNHIVEAIQGSEEIAHEDHQHDLSLRPEYAEFTGEQLAEEARAQFPWCPLCNPQNPDAPGDFTIPDAWPGL